ncbi:MAG: YdeI/OmpD-associated family protein [Myxococcales bacterium]|nr:YdeI/OmpD-associated family protein [Myxococcales bacterium]
MASTDDLPTIGFDDAAHFGMWLREHHRSAPGLWLKIPKKGKGGTGPTYGEALEEALRFGWIDSQKATCDECYFVQRFTPRRSRSKWSKINRKKAEELIASGHMEQAGQVEVDRAKEDGRWATAYDSPSTATVPPDFQKALDARPNASAFFESLTSAKRFSILFRIHDAKRADTRKRRIETFADMCARGESPT